MRAARERVDRQFLRRGVWHRARFARGFKKSFDADRPTHIQTEYALSLLPARRTNL
jgi:hypothetical protein